MFKSIRGQTYCPTHGYQGTYAGCSCSLDIKRPNLALKEAPYIENLIFEGGGPAGIAYGGALMTMEQNDFLKNLKRVGGASAGAITGGLEAFGYLGSEIMDIITKTKFSSFQDDSVGLIRDSVRLIKYYGWNKGDVFKDWFSHYVKAKLNTPDATFGDLASIVESSKNPGMKYLYVMGTNLTKQRSEIYSHETCPNMKIVDAVRISMSIPLFFQAVINDEGDILVDGGVANNYPIKMFDKRRYYDPEGSAPPEEDVFNPHTLGFRLDTRAEIAANNESWGNVSVNINDLGSYIKAVLNYFMEVANKKHLTDSDKARTIFIDKAHVTATDFDLSNEDIALLVKNGASAVKKYFDILDN